MQQLISILIPVYNGEFFLHACLNSIAAQTYKNIEVVIIDDGSCDRSVDVCKGFAKANPGLNLRIITQDRLGGSVARNRAVREAKGNLIAFIDQDDMITPDYLEVLHDIMCKHGVDMACCGVDSVDFKGNFLAQLKQSKYFLNRVLGTTESLNAYMCYNIRPEAWGRLMKKSLYNNIQYPEEHSFQDIITHLNLVASSESVYITDKYMYKYRENTTGVVRTALTNSTVIRDQYSSYGKVAAVVDEYGIVRGLSDHLFSIWLGRFRNTFFEYQNMAFKYSIITDNIDYGKKLAFYGAGQMGLEYVKLNERRFNNLIFIDRDKNKTGLLGYPVVSPDEYCRRYKKEYKLMLTCRFLFSAAKELLRTGAIDSPLQLMFQGGLLPVEKDLANALSLCIPIFDKIENEALRKGL